MMHYKHEILYCIVLCLLFRFIYICMVPEGGDERTRVWSSTVGLPVRQILTVLALYSTLKCRIYICHSDNLQELNCVTMMHSIHFCQVWAYQRYQHELLWQFLLTSMHYSMCLIINININSSFLHLQSIYVTISIVSCITPFETINGNNLEKSAWITRLIHLHTKYFTLCIST